MAIKSIKSTSNARRQMTVQVFDVTSKKPQKKLTFGKRRINGRNCYGRMTIENRGGGAKRKLRLVDFNRTSKLDVSAKVVSLEYDPNRSSNIALIEYSDKELAYILAPSELKVGQEVICSDKAKVSPGNRMKMKNMLASSQIFNIEMAKNRGGQMARSAGNFATLMGIDGDEAIVRLPSGEIRKVKNDLFATLGTGSNPDHANVVIGKAGRVRNMGRRPNVRGKAKNPCDHPHGGGEGNTSIGMPHPKTAWGMPALGHKTRNKNKRTNSEIVKRRK